MSLPGEASVGPSPPERCRYCASEIPVGAIKCSECKSIQRFDIRILGDTQLLLAIVTPVSALVAALTYLVSTFTPLHSSVSLDPISHGGAANHFVLVNKGHSNAQLIKVGTRIYFSDVRRLAAKVENRNFLSAAPLTTSLESGVIPPGAKPIAVTLQDYDMSKDHSSVTTSRHYAAMVDLLERKLLQYVSAGNVFAAESLIELLTYFVGVDDSRGWPDVERRLEAEFIFKVEFTYVNYDGSRGTLTHIMKSDDYVHWLGNYSGVVDSESALCMRLRNIVKHINSSLPKLDSKRIYKGLCL